METDAATHDHAESFYRQTAESKAIRIHAANQHQAGEGWAGAATMDIVREWHNSQHNRDWFGQPFEGRVAVPFRKPDIWWDEGDVFRQIGTATYGPFKSEEEAEAFRLEEA